MDGRFEVYPSILVGKRSTRSYDVMLNWNGSSIHNRVDDYEKVAEYVRGFNAAVLTLSDERERKIRLHTASYNEHRGGKTCSTCKDGD